MPVVGKVDSLWRYPVKSMRGENVATAFLGFAGVYGDRIFAFADDTAPKGFPYLTGRENGRMVLYTARFRHPQRAARPPNLAEAEDIDPGVMPVYGGSEDLALEVETPEGESFAIDDPALVDRLRAESPGRPALTLLKSDRAFTDCRPVSIFSIQTAVQLEREIGLPIDKRRFRANIYLDLENASGFAEDYFVGRSLRVGAKAKISILERDPRCKMIALDPNSGEENREILRNIVRAHDRCAGVYGAVLVQGTVHQGDAVELLDD